MHESRVRAREVGPRRASAVAAPPRPLPVDSAATRAPHGGGARGSPGAPGVGGAQRSSFPAPPPGPIRSSSHICPLTCAPATTRSPTTAQSSRPPGRRLGSLHRVTLENKPAACYPSVPPGTLAHLGAETVNTPPQQACGLLRWSPTRT
ncbi:hypothetical protein VULLAG_LOCUS11459 [Vulpes lagopus]